MLYISEKGWTGMRENTLTMLTFHKYSWSDIYGKFPATLLDRQLIEHNHCSFRIMTSTTLAEICFRVMNIKFHPSSKILFIAKCEEILLSRDRRENKKNLKGSLDKRKFTEISRCLFETARIKTTFLHVIQTEMEEN